MPDDELGAKSCKHLDKVARLVANEMPDADDPYRNVKAEVRCWFRNRGHPLNAFAEVLWHFARHSNAGAADAPDWLSEALTRWARNAVKQAAADGPTLLRTFVLRAQGYTAHGESVRWNQDRKRFENVPWSLRERFQDAPPANAIVIRYPSEYAAPLDSLWVAADESGYRVRENRTFKGPPDQDRWFCTLEVTEENAGNVESVLSMWQQRHEAYSETFHMVEERKPDAMSQAVRRWIDTARCGDD